MWSGGPAEVEGTPNQGTSGSAAQQFASADLTASGTLSPSCSWTTAWNDRYIIVIAFLPGAAAAPGPSYGPPLLPPAPGWFPGAPGTPGSVPFSQVPVPAYTAPPAVDYYTATYTSLYGGPEAPVSGPNYAGAAADLGGGSGSWVNPGNADGPPDGSVATWTAP